VLPEPVTVAFNVVDCPLVSEAAEGDTVTATGTKLTLAFTFLVGSAALAAVTVTVCADAMVAGAVYTPAAKVPTDGDIDQLTLVLLDPLTVALNVLDCPPVSEAEEGVMLIDTEDTDGVNDTMAVALLVLSAALVALTVTDCDVVTNAGAV
jgi:hypothetical protein